MRVQTMLCLLLAAALAGCSTYRNSTQVQDGPGLAFNAPELKAYRENQDLVLAELTALAGLEKDKPSDNWAAVIEVGMDFADGKCEAYMHALFRLNRDKKTATAQIGLLGAATAGLMAAAESAAKEVAATAILFGLASSTVDNLSSNLLYDLDPSSVRTLVRSLQSRFRSSLTAGYENRSAALGVVRAYAMLCVPANIEAEVNLAVKGSTPFANPGDAATGQPPEVSNAESAVSPHQAGLDDNTAVLRAFVFPQGRRNEDNRKALEKFLRERQITVDVTSFMRLKRFEKERADAVTALKLK